VAKRTPKVKTSRRPCLPKRSLISERDPAIMT
jgi:hypothetical protein